MIEINKIIEELEKDEIKLVAKSDSACTTEGELLIYLKEFQKVLYPENVYPCKDIRVLECPFCKSEEYLFNQNGKPNSYCGNCGKALDWTTPKNKNTFLVIAKLSSEDFTKLKKEKNTLEEFVKGENFFSFKSSKSSKLTSFASASSFPYKDIQKAFDLTSSFKKFLSSDFNVFQVSDTDVNLVKIKKEKQ